MPEHAAGFRAVRSDQRGRGGKGIFYRRARPLVATQKPKLICFTARLPVAQIIAARPFFQGKTWFFDSLAGEGSRIYFLTAWRPFDPQSWPDGGHFSRGKPAFLTAWRPGAQYRGREAVFPRENSAFPQPRAQMLENHAGLAHFRGKTPVFDSRGGLSVPK